MWTFLKERRLTVILILYNILQSLDNGHETKDNGHETEDNFETPRVEQEKTRVSRKMINKVLKKYISI